MDHIHLSHTSTYTRLKQMIVNTRQKDSARYEGPGICLASPGLIGDYGFYRKLIKKLQSITSRASRRSFNMPCSMFCAKSWRFSPATLERMRVDKAGWSCLSFAARGTLLTHHPEKVVGRGSEFFSTYILCWEGWLIKEATWLDTSHGNLLKT